MALPVGVSLVTVTLGPFLDFQGNALAGQTVFTPSSSVLHTATGTPVLNKPIVVPWGVLGTAAVQLPATDDPTLTPINFLYSVQHSFEDRSIPTPPVVPIQLPRAVTSVDLDLLIPASGTSGVTVNLPTVLSVAGNSGTVTGTQLAAVPELRAASVSAVSAAIADGSLVVPGGGGGTAAVAAPRAIGRMSAGLARRTTQPTRFLGKGSSTMAGTGAATAAGRLFNQVVAFLQASYPSGRGAEAFTVYSFTAEWSPISTDAGVQGYNAGAGGTVSANFSPADITTRGAQLGPCAVLYIVGPNDWKQNVSPATYKANMLAAIDSHDAQSTVPAVHILIHAHPRMDVSNPTYTWASYGTALREIAAANPDRCMFIDVSLAFAATGLPATDPLDLVDVDNIHLTPAGHTMAADLVRQQLDVPPAITPAAVADTTAPTVPGGLTATAGNAQVSLAWTASTDNVGVAKYRVRRGGTVIAEPTTNSYVNTGLTNGTAYAFTVSALDAAGNESAQTSSVSATPAASSDTTAPTVPTNVAAGTPTSSSVPLSWTASTDAVGVTGYRVYNGTTFLTSVTGTSTTVTGLTASTAYSLAVSAIDAAGNESAKSTAVSVTTAAASGGGLTVLTSDSFTGADTANITGRSTDAALGGTPATWQCSTNTTNFFATSGGRMVQGNAPGAAFEALSVTAADQSISVLVAALPSSGHLLYILGRRSALSGTNNAYRLSVDSTGAVVMQKVLAGTATSLSVTTTIVAGDVLELRMVGTTISLYKNDTLIGSATNNEVAASTYAGIATNNGTVSTFALDNLVIKTAA